MAFGLAYVMAFGLASLKVLGKVCKKASILCFWLGLEEDFCDRSVYASLKVSRRVMPWFGEKLL
jgi:hypothetical protein